MPGVEMRNKTDLMMSPLGDCGIVVQFGSSIEQETHNKVQSLRMYLEQYPFPGIIEIVPAFVTIAVFYDPMKLTDPFTGEGWRNGNGGIRSPYEMICSIMERIVSELDQTTVATPRIVDIPVCYGGDFGPDLADVASHNRLTVDEVIQIHSTQEYLVYMIGFAPGFPYLGGMSERIAAPRRDSPRLTIPEGTVGIGGSQTGIYPISTPGGWQLIGRTPLRLFRPEHQSPSLLKAGDIVRFYPIGLQQYEEWKEDCI